MELYISSITWIFFLNSKHADGHQIIMHDFEQYWVMVRMMRKASGMGLYINVLVVPPPPPHTHTHTRKDQNWNVFLIQLIFTRGETPEGLIVKSMPFSTLLKLLYTPNQHVLCACNKGVNGYGFGVFVYN